MGVGGEGGERCSQGLAPAVNLSSFSPNEAPSPLLMTPQTSLEKEAVIAEGSGPV